MAVNKNFVVKNGLEVATDVILADASTKNVGIGSTIPTLTLDVRGGIGATDLQVTGFSTFTDDLQVGASGSVFYVSNSTNMVGVGTSVPAYLLDVRSPVSTGQTALYVFGDMRVTGDINLDDITLDDATIDNLTVEDTLTVAGITTLASSGGITTTGGQVYINTDLNVGGASTFTGLGQIGVGSEGTFIGTGVTMVDFKSSNAGNTVDVTTGIATVTVQTGASIGLVIALGG